ncbi:hypothetical protein TraAM80_07968 [Trypanosoma rangeli]|uniref:Uncharacterized protein n=1 Tax=Trypanosoma rangeli TaxID=5698 RepID=A0A422N2U9_TRYRA|nr:uncharacterized protein TraAM80_07968 [Trypanosoma rangeli]RNE99780.1 hypothetical protein TraAM80_07968 [Trypanosoma rangeli]|eukprot:RNE99780.1 hypothetical protein TraAM80_07968 [Trypanosoma rangeli]
MEDDRKYSELRDFRDDSLSLSSSRSLPGTKTHRDEAPTFSTTASSTNSFFCLWPVSGEKNHCTSPPGKRSPTKQKFHRCCPSSSPTSAKRLTGYKAGIVSPTTNSPPVNP